jgi:hypothetical protein
MVHLGEGSARSGALAILIDLQLIPFAIIGAWLFIRSHRRAPAVLIPAGAV